MNLQELLQTQYTDDQLKEEIERRKHIKWEAEKRRLAEQISCRNCKHRTKGYCTKTVYYKSVVCSKRPKAGWINKTHSEPEQVYFVCSHRYTNNCEMFEHK